MNSQGWAPHPAVFIVVILFLWGKGAGNICRELCFFCNFRFCCLWKQLHILWAIRVSYGVSSEERGVLPVDRLSISWHRQSGFGKHLALLWSAQVHRVGPRATVSLRRGQPPNCWPQGGFAGCFLWATVMEFLQGRSQRKKVKVFTSVCSLNFSLFSCQLLCWEFHVLMTKIFAGNYSLEKEQSFRTSAKSKVKRWCAQSSRGVLYSDCMSSKQSIWNHHLHIATNTSSSA